MISRILFLVLSISPSVSITLLSQEKNGSTIRGIITDSISTTPLENAIIYLPNSPIGTSSAEDGSFLLENIPPGDVGLVISRVDYRRIILPLHIGDSTAIDLKIQLSTKYPVSEGVEIFGEADTEGVTLGNYVPLNSPGVLCVYGASDVNAIVLISTDTALFMLSVDMNRLDGENYLRVWVLFFNVSDVPYDFFPERDIQLSLNRAKYGSLTIPQENVDWLWKLLDSNEVFTSITTSVQRSLESMAIKRTQHLYNNEVFIKLLFLGALLRLNQTRTLDKPPSYTPSQDESLSGRLFRTYSLSVNAGLLSRKLVYPGNGIHGYLYFPYPGLRAQSNNRSVQPFTPSMLNLVLTTPTGTHKVAFLAE